MTEYAHLGQQSEPFFAIILMRSPYPSVTGNGHVALLALTPCRMLWNIAARSLAVPLKGMMFCIEEAALLAHAAFPKARLGGSCHGEQRRS